jgi:PAS domain S-box-containing protein
MSIIVVRKKEDVKDCDIAIIDCEDPEILKEVKNCSKFVLILGKKAERSDLISKISNLLFISKLSDLISDYELFKCVVEQSPDPIIIFHEGSLLYANRKARDYFGSENLQAKKILDFVPSEYQKLVIESINKIEKEKAVIAELPVILTDGKKIWFETSFAPIDFRGRPAVLSILRDITEKKKLKENLEESNRKYLELFVNSLDIIAVTDLDGKFIEVNKAFEDAFGYKNEDVKGQYFAEILKLDNNVANKVFESYNKAFREKRDLRGLVFKVKKRDGSDIVVEGNVRLLWQGDRIVGFVGNYRDITDRVELERRLKEKEEIYQSIFENSPLHISLIDENGVVIEANPSMVKSLGIWPVGKKLKDLFSAEIAERRMYYLRKSLEEGKLIVDQDVRDDRYFVNNYVPIELSGEKLCLVIIQEISEIVKLNKLLRQIIEVNKAMARIRDRRMLTETVERILSDYSAKISENPIPGNVCFDISYGDKNYGYLCVNSAQEMERDLLKTLADDLAFAFRSIEDEKREEELYERLVGNIQTIAYLVDGIRNPLAVMLAYAEMLIDDERAKERIFQQVDRIVRIMQELDRSWFKSEELTRRRSAQSNNFMN